MGKGLRRQYSANAQQFHEQTQPVVCLNTPCMNKVFIAAGIYTTYGLTNASELAIWDARVLHETTPRTLEKLEYIHMTTFKQGAKFNHSCEG